LHRFEWEKCGYMQFS